MYGVGKELEDKVTKQKVMISRIDENISQDGSKVLCFELSPLGFNLPNNAKYYITQSTLDEYFILR